MPEYPIPERVLRNAEQRLEASRIRKNCTTCGEPATHWPATGHPACETCRITSSPTPDPARSLAGLRARRDAELAAGQATSVTPQGVSSPVGAANAGTMGSAKAPCLQHEAPADPPARTHETGGLVPS